MDTERVLEKVTLNKQNPELVVPNLRYSLTWLCPHIHLGFKEENIFIT